ncbi:MAG: hypothetical protein R3E97_16165 [Candidatus Eisenbacteria bacterium]
MERISRARDAASTTSSAASRRGKSGSCATRTVVVPVAAALFCLAPTWTHVALAEDAPAVVPDAVPVKVEREKPDRTKKPSLRFLQENLDFLRGQIDGVYWSEEPRDGAANAIDPSWIRYLELDRDVDSATEQLDREAADLASDRLLESVGELAEVEARIRALAMLLDEHDARLTELHEDYVEDHVTSLVVLASGYPDWQLDGLRLRRDDGRETAVALDRELESVLHRGGVIELDHEFIEPREQVLELVIPASTDQAGRSVYLRIDPERDRLHFLQLDLATFRLGDDTSAWKAETWSRPTSLGGLDWTW